MHVPEARGELSSAVFAALRNDRPAPDLVSVDDDEDLQITLWALYELHYRGFADVDPAREWDTSLLDVRAELEGAFEATLRTQTSTLVEPAGSDLVAELERIVRADGPSVASYLHRHATEDQFLEFLSMRSVYHLKETDPHSWLLPRLTGPAKAALAEIAYDEYGGGRPEAVHQQLYADALVAVDLDATYGHYIDRAPAHVLAVNNAMSLFGLHRRLRGACAGHLAAFEMTSSLPCRRIAQGSDRLGLPAAVHRYFDEHIEADAVHEHIASRNLCGSMVDAEPGLFDDVLFGAAACVHLDALSGSATIADWEAQRTALRVGSLEPAA